VLQKVEAKEWGLRQKVEAKELQAKDRSHMVGISMLRSALMANANSSVSVQLRLVLTITVVLYERAVPGEVCVPLFATHSLCPYHC
jgi:hypothetical protein